MVDEIKREKKDEVVSLRVLTADTRPTDVGTGSVLLELDGEKRLFQYSEKNINPVTSDGWWEL